MPLHALLQARLREFLDLGITRVSMGVQSFDAGLLEACGRAHSLADVYQAVEVLRKAAMDNFSIDLMRCPSSGGGNQDSWGVVVACSADPVLTRAFLLKNRCPWAMSLRHVANSL